jgi:homoserine dehydrogenase
MPGQRLIVLKFGGSVLQNEDSLALAVTEIDRWQRQDWRVIAVVSALGGHTDRILERCESLSPNSSAASKAAALSNGEANSAALLGLLLDRSHINASVCSPGGIGLIAAGEPLDATPTQLDTANCQALLDLEGTLVVPGYVGVDPLGRPVVFGRGGSDLTALFLAHQLSAGTCRLIKDVDGLYTHDPTAPGIPPERYVHATWDDALRTDGSIVQHKAVRFAQEHGIRFELCECGGINPTLIGARSTQLEERNNPGKHSSRPTTTARKQHQSWTSTSARSKNTSCSVPEESRNHPNPGVANF